MPRITYEITSSGGVQVARLFDGIADAAGRAQQKLDRQNRQASVGLRLVSGSMQEVRAAADQALASIGPVGSVLGTLSTAGVAGAAVAGIGALGAVLLAGTKRAVEWGDALNDAAQQVGIGVEALQEYRYAAGQVGVSNEKLDKGLRVLVKNIGDAQAGTGQLATILKKTDSAFLGTVKAAGSTEDAVALVIDKIASLSSVTEQASLAQAAFGRGGVELLPFLSQGAEGLKRMREEARRLGIVVSGELVSGLETTGDKLDRLAQTIRGNVTTALAQLAPLLGEIATVLAEQIGQIGQAFDRQFGVSLQGKIAQAEQQLRELRAASQGFSLVDMTSGEIEQLERRLEALAAAEANLAEQRRQTRVREGSDARRAQAEKDVEAAVEAARKAAPEPADKLREIEAERRKALEALRTAAREAPRRTVTRDGEPRQELEVAQAEDLARKKEEIERRYQAARKKAEQEAAKDAESAAQREASAAESAAKKEVAAAEQAARRKQALEEEVAEARRAAALAGLEGDARIREQARQEVERFKTRVKAEVEDRQEAARLVAAYAVEVEREATQQIDQLRAAQAERDQERARQVWEREQELDAQRLREAEENAQRAAAAEERAAEEAQRNAERTAETFIGPLEGTLERVQRDLGDWLVDAFLRGGDAARGFEEIVLDVLDTIAREVVQLALSKVVLEPLSGVFGGVLGGGGSGGAQGAAAAATSSLASSASDAAVATQSSTASLLKLAGAAATAAGAVAAAGAAIGSGRQDIQRASYGQTGPGNAYTATAAIGTVAGVGSGAAIGAAVGTAVPGIGNIVGALVGAAVGGVLSSVISKELGGSLSKGISDGVSEGLDQAGLDRKVSQEVGANPLLNILSGGLNTVLAPLLSPLFTPDIERIFEKILRQQLGGVGGYNTTGIPVDPQGTFGLRPLAGTAGRAGRIIAEGFGAGGEAYGEERERRFRSVLLAVTRRETDKTGEEAGVVLAQVFAAAFQGAFSAALRAAIKSNRRSTFLSGLRDDDLAFTAQQFRQASPNYGFDYSVIADTVRRQDRAPGTKAQKAAQDAFANAFRESLVNAADSQAFRRALSTSVSEAFAGRASQLLTKSFGDLFAPFFALSRRTRRRFRRQRRRGDVAAGIQTLATDFGENINDFVKAVSDPALPQAFLALQDAVLKLQVATAAASGDVSAAAAAIEGALGASITLVRDYQQLDRDIRSRTRLAEAGPGIAQDRASIDALREQRRAAEARLGSFGNVGFDQAGGLFGSALVGGETRVVPIDPAEYLGPLREFAEARLAELESEIALARQLEETFGDLADQFRDLRSTIAATLGRSDPTTILRDQVAAVEDAFAALGAVSLDEVDPEKFTDLATALSTAIATASARFAELTEAIETFDTIGRDIARTLGGSGADTTRLRELFRTINELVPTVTGGGAGAPQATQQLAAQVAEAVSLATSRRAQFQQLAGGFEGLADQAAVQGRGRRAQRQQLQRVRSELAALLPQALAGDADALARAQELASQALSLSQSGGASRRVAAEVEALATQLGAVADQQVTVAEQQLEELERIAAATADALGAQRTAVEEQLARLDTIAAEAGVQTATLKELAAQRVEAVRAELVTFRTLYGPLITRITSAAEVRLYNELLRIEAALGTDGAIVQALQAVRARLPVSGGTRNAVLEPVTSVQQTAAPQGPTISGPIVIQFQQPPKSAVEAREFGRIMGDALTERITSVVRRQQVRKVA